MNIQSVILGESKDGYKVALIDSTQIKLLTCVYQVKGAAISPDIIKSFPTNFSIVNGVIKDTCGVFSRLNAVGNVQPHVVVQELVTHQGVVKGFWLINPATQLISVIRKDDILRQQSTTKTPLLQNAVIRGDAISCYPHSKFLKRIIGAKTQEARPKSVIRGKQPEFPKAKSFIDNFTPEQKHELSLAKRNNVDLRLIANPKLSPQQMRVIWFSKTRGAYSEYFAKPEYSVDVMKFYADRLVTPSLVTECTDLLAHPEFDIDKLSVLYLAICEGIDYSSFINASSAEDMFVKRSELSNAQWGSENKTPRLAFSELETSNPLVIKVANKLKEDRYAKGV